MAIKQVGVIGCGLMGSGIAQVSAQAGFPTVVIEANQAFLDRGLGGMRKSLEGLLAKAKMEDRAKDETLGRINGSVDFNDLKDCDLVIEAITENQPLKNETFARLDAICRSHALLASNPSSCNIPARAAATKRPGQVLGLHFFNPVPLMKLVEVVQSILTDDATVAAAYEWVQAVGKVPVKTKDSTAFIVNRLLVPYLLDAIRVYEGGLATLEDIDQAMKLGCGYPMGPFTLLDLVGLDTTMFVAEVMFEEFREPRYAPPPLLKRMVMAGRLGRKTGRGFYDYGREKRPGAGRAAPPMTNLFYLSDEQRAVRDLAREIARERIAPLAAHVDETGEYPQEQISVLGKQGLMGLHTPEEYGGGAAGSLALRPAARGGAGGRRAARPLLHPIISAGPDTQRRRSLPRIAAGEITAAFSLSEASSGSDAAALTC